MIFDASFETEKEISMDFDESDQELDMDPIDERTDLFPVRSVDGVVADPAGNIDLSEARDRLISERVTQTFDERKDELIGPAGPAGPQGPPGESIVWIEHQYAVNSSKDSISDVEAWVRASSLLSQRIRSCIYANDYYVVCGLGGEVGYSTDLINWAKITPFTSGALTNITYGKGKFIIVDEFNNLWIAEGSPKEWERIAVENDFPGDIGSITYANGLFVIVGEYMAAFSEDGFSWTIVDAPGNYNQIAYGNGRYVAVGVGGAVGVSYDGSKWNDKSNAAVTGDLRAVTYAKGKYIIGGIDGLIMYTEDFVTWGIATSNSSVRYVRQIVYAENKYYAACYTSAGMGEIWVSNDGMSWIVQQQMTMRLWCLLYNESKLLAAGDSGAVFVLDLDIDWKDKPEELRADQYLWERIVVSMSDGSKIYGDAVCVGGSGGVAFTTDETLTLKDGILSVNTTKEPEPDNTLPITSAAVHATVGNISAILDTI